MINTLQNYIYSYFTGIDNKSILPDKFLVQSPTDEQYSKYIDSIDDNLYSTLVYSIELIAENWKKYELSNFDFLKEGEFEIGHASSDYRIITLWNVLNSIRNITISSQEPTELKTVVSTQENKSIKIIPSYKDIETLVKSSGRLGVDPLIGVMWEYINKINQVFNI